MTFLNNINKRLGDYKDIVVFIVSMLLANALWKLAVHGDDTGMLVSFCGLNVTAPFEMISRHIAKLVYSMISLFRHTAYMPTDHIIAFTSGNSSGIVWSCSGIKQAWIWFAIMLTTRGPWFKKMWFIPFGWLVCHLFNILRIFLICLSVENHPTWFPFLHTVVFKYLFYGIMFLMWLWWTERLVPRLTVVKSNSLVEPEA